MKKDLSWFRQFVGTNGTLFHLDGYISSYVALDLKTLQSGKCRTDNHAFDNFAFSQKWVWPLRHSCIWFMFPSRNLCQSKTDLVYGGLHRQLDTKVRLDVYNNTNQDWQEGRRKIQAKGCFHVIFGKTREKCFCWWLFYEAWNLGIKLSMKNTCDVYIKSVSRRSRCVMASQPPSLIFFYCD